MDAMYDFGSMGFEGAGPSERDHNLPSLDISRCSTTNSSPSFFGDPRPSKSMPKAGGRTYLAPSVSSPSSSIFEFPSLDELDSFGCDLLNGFWDEDQVQNTLNRSGYGAGALNFTFGEPESAPSTSSFDLKPPLTFTNTAPTLTELNMEDSLDSLFSLKPKCSATTSKGSGVTSSRVTTAAKPAALSMPATPENRWKVIRDEHSGLSISPTTWNNVKHSQELSKTGLYVPKEGKPELIQGTSSSPEKPKVIERRGRPPQRITSTSTESGRVDFANLFGRRARKPNAGTPGRKPLPISISSLKLQDDGKKSPTSPMRKLKLEEKSNKRLIVSSRDGFPNKHLHKDVEDDDNGAESHDEGLGSENEEEHHEFNEDYDDDLADDASDISEEIAGPLTLSLDPSNVAGSSHVKSRRSEYDDFTPNPEKLLFIGRELQKLNNTIHDMKPTGDPNGMSRNKTRREKNKLASRACRLKKKAQHEANKLKIRALREEHDSLSETIRQVKVALQEHQENPSRVDGELVSSKLGQLIGEALGKPPVAGQTDSYVNMVLDRTAHSQQQKNKD